MNHFNRMIFRLFVLFMLVAALSGCGAVDQTQKATLTIPDGAIISSITKQQTDKVSGMENVRFAGCFDVIEKKPS